MTPLRGSNHVGMRAFNERMVLRAIRVSGPIAKADLARLTQLSIQTISIIVNRLLDEGLLLTQARIRGKIGQPSVPLTLNPDGAFSLGIQVGRRSLELAVIDFTGAIRQQWQFAYPYPDPAVVLPKIRHGLALMQKKMGPAWTRAVGVGLSAPLAMHKWGDLLGPEAHHKMAAWETTQLLDQVRAMTPLPVTFAKDTAAACLAEWAQGRGREIPNFLYVFLGTFVGGGLVLDGHLVPGAFGNNGAIGSLPLGLSTLRMPPQLLQLASGWPLEQALIAARLDPHRIRQASIMASDCARLRQTWLRHASNALAQCAASASSLLDLDAVVMDGSVHPDLMQALVAQTQERLASYRFDGIHQPSLQRGLVGPHARALGSALLPLQTEFFPDKNLFLKQAPA